jgi:hypothetical protein
MIANGNPLQDKLSSLLRHGNQTQIGRSAANITHQDHISNPDLFPPPFTSRLYPSIASGLGLFE